LTANRSLSCTAHVEAQRLIRISEEGRLAADKVDPTGGKEPDSPTQVATNAADNGYDKLTTSKLAKAPGMRTGQLNEKLLATGFLERDGDMFKLTDKGKAAGGEFRVSKQHGPFFLWPTELKL
jgi:hypothetical protein